MTGCIGEAGVFFKHQDLGDASGGPLVLCSRRALTLYKFVMCNVNAACVSPNMVVANALSGLAIVTLILTSGFAIVHYSIPPWAIWAYWISPHAYALR